MRTKLPGRPRTGPYLKCETCGTEFYVSPARVRQVEKNGHRIRFCSQKCYIKDGDKNPFWGGRHTADTIRRLREHPNRPRFKHGEGNPNFVRFATNTFVGSAFDWWRRWLHRNINHCEECGYSEHKEILEVHHLDRNPENNQRNNLRLLCPNCHQWWHWQHKNGRYHHGYKKTEERKGDGAS